MDESASAVRGPREDHMKRRDFVKSISLGGTVLAASKLAAAQRWKADPNNTSYIKVDDGHQGPWPHWPFDEIRIPYRERFGKVKWPNGGPLCVYINVATEWSGHAVMKDPKSKVKRDLRAETEEGQYEMNVGVWRAVRLLDKFGVKVSIYAHAGMVEAFPDLYRELHSKGHEIMVRPFTGEPTTELTSADERAEMQRCVDLITKVTGERPVGFDNPGGVLTEDTPQNLVDLGFTWIGGLRGDDLPYGLRLKDGKKLAVVGHLTTANDLSIFEPSGLRGPTEAFAYTKDIFDAYYRLGVEEYPGALNYGIHPHVSLMPDRYGFQERFLDYILGFKDVWFARSKDVADYWTKTYLNS